MKKRFVTAGVVLFAAMAVWVGVEAADPGEGANPAKAINDPDAYAWDVFIEINKDAGLGDGRVVWETWKNANNRTEVFLLNGSKPPAWAAPVAQPARPIADLESAPAQLRARADRFGHETALAFDPNVGEGNEVRMNRAAFDFIRDNGLYTKKGQLAFFGAQDPRRPVGFPTAAKEIKAQWRALAPGQDPAKFHTTRVVGSGQLWGLTSLHIITKDTPNWFWATFEHVDNENREAVIPSVDRSGRPASLNGTKWANYVLRGSQLDFTTPTGEPTLLASSQIEAGIERTSSCITCHARATVGRYPGGPTTGPLTTLEFMLPNGDGAVGTPDPQWFSTSTTNPPTRTFFQVDFVWSLRRAVQGP